MNCRKEVLPNEGKLFAEVFVCPDCYLVAERMMDRALKELKLVLVMMKDTIRVGLLNGKLQFRTPEELRVVKKSDFLAELGRLVEEAQERNAQAEWQSKTQSSETSKQFAPPVDGSES
jgi:hypothetical protein